MIIVANRLYFYSTGKSLFHSETNLIVILNDNFSNFETNCQCQSKLPDCFY